MSGNPLRELKRDEAIIEGGLFVRYRTPLKAAWDLNEMDVGRLRGSVRETRQYLREINGQPRRTTPASGAGDAAVAYSQMLGKDLLTARKNGAPYRPSTRLCHRSTIPR